MYEKNRIITDLIIHIEVYKILHILFVINRSEVRFLSSAPFFFRKKRALCTFSFLFRQNDIDCSIQNQAKPCHCIMTAVKGEIVVFTNLGYDNRLTFNARVHQFGMSARGIRIRTYFAYVTGFCGQNEGIFICEDCLSDFVYDSKMFRSGCERFLQIKRIFYFGYRAEDQSAFIFRTSCFAFFECADRGRTGP